MACRHGLIIVCACRSLNVLAFPNLPSSSGVILSSRSCMRSCVRVLFLERSLITRSCRSLPRRGCSGACASSGDRRLSVSVCRCCVSCGSDPPHLRIVARAEWSVTLGCRRNNVSSVPFAWYGDNSDAIAASSYRPHVQRRFLPRGHKARGASFTAPVKQSQIQCHPDFSTGLP